MSNAGMMQHVENDPGGDIGVDGVNTAAKAEGKTAEANADAIIDHKKTERGVRSAADDALRDELRKWGQNGSGN
jgi:hypothetical protein